tara:strand:- start:241 stop:474 length:234 start_codon:yes stop_codon:yes gene_type:complete
MDINAKYLSIILFLIFYSIIVFIKPNFIYNNKDDTLRQFGVGYKNTTVLSLWLVSIFLAIFSYYVVIYWLNLQNLWF